MMPEINGYDVCFQLRFNKDFRRIPIILVTVREREIDAIVGDRINIEYLQKPVQPGELLSKVVRLLGLEAA
jgi:DNA-binding response OmpR family regulator